MESGMMIDRIMAVADEGFEFGGRQRERGGARKRTHFSQNQGEVGHPADEEVFRGGGRKDRGRDSHVSQKRRDVGHPQYDLGHSEEVGRLGLHLGSVSLTRKQRGEMAEAAFLAKAAGLGFRVSKPWGESSRYDLIVDNGRKLLRMQVKSAHRADEFGGYTFHAHGNTARAYRSSEIDFLAAYVVPVDTWYLFPVEEFRKYKSMKLFPSSRRRRSKFEKFREAWWMVM
jgi:hypothetical protein